MNISNIHESDQKVLLQSIRLCEAIGPYIELLSLDRQEVAIFKKDVRTVQFISEHNRFFSNSFILYSIVIMRKRLVGLIHECQHSINYNPTIAKTLGIEVQAKFTSIPYQDLDFYISFKN
jgi:hypothetical protein